MNLMPRFTKAAIGSRSRGAIFSGLTNAPEVRMASNDGVESQQGPVYGSQIPTWSRSNELANLFVTENDRNSVVLRRNDICIVIRGYAVCDRRNCETSEQVAELVLEHYLTHSEIPFRILEGSFVVMIFDSRRARVLMYRNLAGTTNLFFRKVKRGESRSVLFSTNLRDLVKLPEPFAREAESPSFNESLLPVYFLYRCIPGRETLFKDCYRLMPGELFDCTASKDWIVNIKRVAGFDDLKQNSAQKIRTREHAVEQIAETLHEAVADCVRSAGQSAVMLSGGVDSSLLQTFWNRIYESQGEKKKSFCVTVDHPRTHEEFLYAKSAADQMGVELEGVSADRPFAEYLLSVIDETAETPNHVQAAYFPELAEAMVCQGVTTGISGEAGDGVFGVGTAYDLQLAQQLRERIKSKLLCKLFSSACVIPRLGRLKQHLKTAAILHDKTHFQHPINRQASYTHLDSVLASFGESATVDAFAYRRELVVENRLTGSLVGELHAANILTSSINSGSYWNTLFEIRGGQVLNPFLDSRVLSLAMSLDESLRFPKNNPKALLKHCLTRQGHYELGSRRKLGFGQPIFQWLSPKGQLRDLVEAIDPMPFVDSKTLEQAKKEPNWFLYSLLCLDLLKKS